jgi:hypothetical protein
MARKISVAMMLWAKYMWSPQLPAAAMVERTLPLRAAVAAAEEEEALVEGLLEDRPEVDEEEVLPAHQRVPQAALMLRQEMAPLSVNFVLRAGIPIGPAPG